MDFGGRETIQPIPFAKSLYSMVKEYPHIIQFVNDGSLIIHSPKQLEKEVLLNYFRHGKYASFQRQLNNFGYRRASMPGIGTVYRRFYGRGPLKPESILTLRHGRKSSPKRTESRYQDHTIDSAVYHSSSDKEPHLAAHALLLLKAQSIV
mmetsp:Transcript_16159/g.21149  ORF Transcript_16159/g.21149 Transcript_16159/m.21149 type:complete len:150 (-) Transcript_16159:2509-2958(-)